MDEEEQPISTESMASSSNVNSPLVQTFMHIFEDVVRKLDIMTFLRLKSTCTQLYHKCLDAERLLTVDMCQIRVKAEEIDFVMHQDQEFTHIDLLLQTRFKLHSCVLEFELNCTDDDLDRLSVLLKDKKVSIGLLELSSVSCNLDKLKDFIKKFGITCIIIYKSCPDEYLSDPIMKMVRRLQIGHVSCPPDFLLKNHIDMALVTFAKKQPMERFRPLLKELVAGTRRLHLWGVGPIDPNDVEKLFLNWTVVDKGAEGDHPERPLVVKRPPDNYLVMSENGPTYGICFSHLEGNYEMCIDNVDERSDCSCFFCGDDDLDVDDWDDTSDDDDDEWWAETPDDWTTDEEEDFFLDENEPID